MGIHQTAFKLAGLVTVAVALPGCGSLKNLSFGHISTVTPDLVCKVNEKGGGLHIVDRKTGDEHAALYEISPIKNGIMSGRGGVYERDSGEESPHDWFTADFNQARCYAGIKYWVNESSAPMAPELLSSPPVLKP